MAPEAEVVHASPKSVTRMNDTLESSKDDTADRPSRFPWPPVLLVAIVGLAVALGRLFPLPWPGLDDLPARAVGIGIGALGVLLIAWAIWTLHRARTTVMPHRGSENLVTTGPFARFRNPIYLGDTMVLLGIAELTKNAWFAAGAPVFMLLVTFLAILPEERHLEARFGERFREYKARSRRWL